MSKPRLLIVNGWSANASLWNRAVELLNSSAYLVDILDLDGLSTIEGFKQAFEDKINKQTVIIAWSLGANLVCDYLLNNSEESSKIIGLIVLQANPCFLEKDNWHLGYSQSDFLTLRNLCETNDLNKMHRIFSLLIGQGATKSDRKWIKESYRLSELPGQEVLLFGLDVLAKQDIRDRLNEINVPMIWMLGDKDSLVNPALASHLNSITVPVKTISGMSHVAFGDSWGQVQQCIEQFVSGLSCCGVVGAGSNA